MKDDDKTNVASHGQRGGITAAQIVLVQPTRSEEPLERMSAEALEYMKDLAAKYVEWKFPNHKVWNFDTGANDPLHRELRALGLIELMGSGGGPWVLTDAGQRWVMAHRP